MNRGRGGGGRGYYGNRGENNNPHNINYGGHNQARSGYNDRQRHFMPPRRDLEAEILSAINAEFQIHCTDYRTVDEIFHRIEQDPDMLRYIHGNKDTLKEFLICYQQNFYLNPDRPDIVQWRKDQRLVAKNDRKESKREERRKWAKEYEEANMWYDVVHEQNVLRFILSLFLATKETWLRMDLVQKAVKQA